MSEDDSISAKGVWETPYVQIGQTHSLSGSALAEIAHAVLSQGRDFRFLAPGMSMSPFICDSDVITLVPFDMSECIFGSVVAFVQPKSGRLVVHRIVSIAPNHCCIQGDNVGEDDGEIPHGAIIGTVVRIERAGKVVRFGLGPERALIALLSRFKVLPFCIGAARVVCSGIRRLT